MSLPPQEIVCVRAFNDERWAWLCNGAECSIKDEFLETNILFISP